jgi:DNA (cytosine-5)-methyltransferase 1
MAAYYNEHDPFVAQWLRELVKAGLIADGDVDDRSIELVRPADLRGFAQCHFFAGIGGWSYALRLAGWPDDRPVWSGSCPCQPFSGAGKGAGTDDARHLWPQFRRLIRQCRPAVVFGEQVTSRAGRAWLSAVCADLEALAYRTAGADLCGPSVGAFDIRQRLWFVADQQIGLAHHDTRRRAQQRAARLHGAGQAGHDVARRGALGSVGDTERAGLEERDDDNGVRGGTLSAPAGQVTERRGDLDPWDRCEWLHCRDDKWRPVEPGAFPLAARVPGRVGRLRAYGNAIKPHVAAAFIRAYVETAGM